MTLVTQESGAVPSGCFDSSTRLLLPHILSFDELGDSHLEENFDHLSCPSGEKEPACHTRKVGSVACSSHPPQLGSKTLVRCPNMLREEEKTPWQTGNILICSNKEW